MGPRRGRNSGIGQGQFWGLVYILMLDDSWQPGFLGPVGAVAHDVGKVHEDVA
jgi:hypothetical protein